MSEEISDQEELLAKHRQEKKELQAKITALKKTAKNDKKKKKEATELITKLEEELNALIEKQKIELEGGDKTKTESTSESTIKAELDEVTIALVPAESKLTRAQKRRIKKEADDKERQARISEQEKLDARGPRVLELETLNEILAKENLKLHNIPADGDCLYAAVQHQLGLKELDDLDVQELRERTADYMRENKDDFLPFMDEMDEAKFEKYCKDVEKTKLWGGQLELKALSNILKVPIKVMQASGPATILGEQFEGTPLIVVYHRRLYRLGEHYNSTIPLLCEMDE